MIAFAQMFFGRNIPKKNNMWKTNLQNKVIEHIYIYIQKITGSTAMKNCYNLIKLGGRFIAMCNNIIRLLFIQLTDWNGLNYRRSQVSKKDIRRDGITVSVA